MSVHEENDQRSQELDDSDLDNVAGGAGESPPPIEDDKEPGDLQPPSDGDVPPDGEIAPPDEHPLP